MPKRLKIHPEKCIGCKSSELACSLMNDAELNPAKSVACPFCAMFDKEKRTPYKCQLCGNEDPACVSICPTGSIVLVQRKAFYSQPSSLQMKGFTLMRERNKKSTEPRKRAPGADSLESPT